MRFIHNLIQMFRKDDGAYFTYNLGVGFVRASGITFILILLLFSYSRLAPSPSLELQYKDRFTISEVCIQSGRITFWRMLTNDLKDYCVVFSNEKDTYKQFVTEDRYADYLRRKGETTYFNVYKEVGGNIIFLTTLDKKAAEYEFGRLYMRAAAYIANAAAGYLLILAAVLFGIGARQEQLAMKYPRTDVGNDTGDSFGDELDGFGEWDFTNESDTANDRSADTKYTLEDKGGD